MTRDVLRRDVPTPRGREHVREVAAEGAARATVLLVHGNCSSSAFFDPLLRALPADVRGVAVDLRGYGDAEPRPVDATRGVRDFADDVAAVLDALDLARPLVAVAHSAGAGVVLQLATDRPDLFDAILLEAPMSPYGFGGTRDVAGTPLSPDFAGSGGGTANPAFVAALAAGDRSEDAGSPRDVLRRFYVADPAALGEPLGALEELLLDSVLSTRTGDDSYPGDRAPSGTWPGVAPGTRGMNNAISAKYCDLSGFATSGATAPVLWVRGDADAIVSDTSLFDLAQLGALDAVPGWPGAETHPPQPMVAQTRAVLDAYAAAGGRYREEVRPGVGHSPHLEEPDVFLGLLLGLVDTAVADVDAAAAARAGTTPPAPAQTPPSAPLEVQP
ncbi:Alpha/beta hydrolase family protein [Cellulosimicrobium aquatile]|uniref:Alpha/beta hydrolase family protein n=1 Tax=Cellulosimicrobium aquatile TaxID=1612203 RepID=A0A1N6SZP1_9MICO|nr:alpha/beta fold hydrolase [Cellulosimicrobium aquatile]SIQ46447.1 Alpha/beta hydrolase family protein [Cellulosimicrobium aquatile]